MSQDERRPPPPPEPSMEEILGSIRRIILDGGEGAAALPDRNAPAVSSASDGGDPLLLTDIVERGPGRGGEGPVTSGGVALGPSGGPTPPFPPRQPSPDAGDRLLSAPAAEAVTAAFTRAFQSQATAPGGDQRTPLPPTAGRSLEQAVTELLRPMLKAWLDQHLPGIVERIVEAEVRKLVQKAEGR